MAQILKEDVKQDIISAAIYEIDKNGLEKTNMRNIAANAKVTVGNVYRYFKSKDDLINSIVKPTIDEINKALLDASNQQLKLYGNVTNSLTVDEVKIIIDKFIDEMIVVYDKYPQVMKIILKNHVLSFNIIRWLSKLLSQLNENWSSSKQEDELFEAYAIAIFTGVSHIFVNTKERDRLALLAKVYLYRMIEVVGE